MAGTSDEHVKLIRDILATESFTKAPLRSKLLQYLYKNRDRSVSAKEISSEAFGLTEHHFSPDSIRQQCKDLRDRLVEFTVLTDLPWCCEFPDGQSGVGYQPRFYESRKRLPTRAFWKPHTAHGDVVIVRNEPMFYFDIATLCYLRYADTNPPDGDRSVAIAELRRLHEKDLDHFGGDLDSRLRPSRLFVGVGEILATDTLGAWFDGNAAIAIRKLASEKISSVRDCSPILLGNMRVNKFISKFLDSDLASHLHYRFHPATIGSVVIRDPQPEEVEAVRRFPQSTDATGALVIATPPTVSPVRDRLVVLTRMTNPGTNGSVTMISSDATRAMSEVCSALTNDEQTEALLRRMGWPQEPLPASFEMLFSVRIAPGHVDDEAGLPEVLGCRVYRP